MSPPARQCRIPVVLLLTRLLWASCVSADESADCKRRVDISDEDLQALAKLQSFKGLLTPGALPLQLFACATQDGDSSSSSAEPDLPPAASTGALLGRGRLLEAVFAEEQALPSVSDSIATRTAHSSTDFVLGQPPDGADWQPAVETASETPAAEGVPETAEGATEGVEGVEMGEAAGAEEAEGGEEGGEEGEEGGEEEGEEEIEFTDVDVGVGGMLLGSVAFVMLLFYFVNWQDDDIRRYSWSIISTTVSIFTAVLIFHGVHEALMYVLGLEELESGFLLLLITYTFFLIWFSMMQLIIAWETGTLTPYVPADLNQEAWTIANAMRYDYGMIIDTKYVRNPQATKSIADMNDTELFVTKKKPNVELMKQRVAAQRTLFAHMTGFASIRAGLVLQRTKFFSQSPFMALVACACNRFFLLVLFKLTESNEIPRRAYEQAIKGDNHSESSEDPHVMCADLCREEVEEAESDVASLATSFLLVQAMRYSLTGVLPNFEGLEEPPIPISTQTIISLYALGLGCAGVVILLLHTGVTLKSNLARVFQNTMGMSLSWCIFWGTRWVATNNEVLQQCNMHPETMIGRIALALLLSACSLALIFGLDHIQDSAGEASEAGHVIQNFINSLSILVGFSWEHCFDFSLEAGASKTSNPVAFKFAFTCCVAVVITPAWRNYILVKVMQLNQLQLDESKASSKKKKKHHTWSFQSDTPLAPAE